MAVEVQESTEMVNVVEILERAAALGRGTRQDQRDLYAIKRQLILTHQRVSDLASTCTTLTQQLSQLLIDEGPELPKDHQELREILDTLNDIGAIRLSITQQARESFVPLGNFVGYVWK